MQQNWIGKYELVRPIHRDSKDTDEGVYLARNTLQHEDQVAVKLTRMKTSAIQRRCKSEALQLEWCSPHPNIVQFLLRVTNKKEGLSALVMELCDCDYLDYISRRGPAVTEKVILSEFEQIVNGVKYLHGVARIAHMDLKPENILVKNSSNGIVLKIADFAFWLPAEEGQVVYYRMGTTRYMAPEMYLLFPCVPPKPVDIYALGATLYTVTQYRLPYQDIPEQELVQIVRTTPPDFVKKLSPAVETLILDMMHPDWKVRPTIGEVAMRI